VAALKTARLFAVVFFWITMVSVLAYVVAFVLMEWAGLYDAALAVGPAEPKAPAPAKAPATSSASWSSVFENSAQAAPGDFYGVGAGGKTKGKAPEPKPEPDEMVPGSASAAPAAAASPPHPPAAPKVEETPVKPAAPAKGDETEGKVVGQSETPPIESKVLTAQEQQQRAAHAYDVTLNILKPMKVVGVMSGFLLGITVFLYLQIALLGRLSGIRQLTNALFMLILFLASVLPWDTVFANFHVNAFYDLGQLRDAHLARLQGKDGEFWKQALFFCRYFGLSVVSTLLLAWAGIQFASGYNDSVTANE
jgi:hypothetical protein